MPPSRFLYLLYSSAEGGNCKNLCNLILSAYSLVSWFYDHSFCFCFFLLFERLIQNRFLIFWISIIDAAFTDYIKGLSPSTLDMELRMLQIIDDGDQQDYKKPELVSIEQLLDYFTHELSRKNNFEFLQAVIRLFLKVKKFFLSMLSLTNQVYLEVYYKIHYRLPYI